MKLAFLKTAIAEEVWIEWSVVVKEPAVVVRPSELCSRKDSIKRRRGGSLVRAWALRKGEQLRGEVGDACDTASQDGIALDAMLQREKFLHRKISELSWLKL